MAEKHEPMKYAANAKVLLELLSRLTPQGQFLVLSVHALTFFLLLHFVLGVGLGDRDHWELSNVVNGSRQWRGTWKDVSGRDAGELSLTVSSWTAEDEFLGAVTVRGLCAYRVTGKITVKRSPFAYRSDQRVRIALDPIRTGRHRLPPQHAPWVLHGVIRDSDGFRGHGLAGRCENLQGQIVGTFMLKAYRPYLSYTDYPDIGIDVGTCETAIQEKTYWDGQWTVKERGEPTGKLRLSISQRSEHLDHFRAQLSIRHNGGEGWQSFTVPVSGRFSGRRIRFSYDPRRLDFYVNRISKMSEIPVRFEGYLQNGVLKGEATHRETAGTSTFSFTPEFSTKHLYRNQGVPE